MDEIDDKKRRNIIIILAVFTALLYFAIFMIADKNSKRTSLKENTTIVTDYSEFYTVDSCANKYIGFLSSKNSASLLNVLDSKFKREQKVTQDNVLNILPTVATGTSFTTKEMYKVALNDKRTKYYLHGFLEVGGMDITDVNRTPGYLIVYLDRENTLFSIEPYDGKEFKEGDFK